MKTKEKQKKKQMKNQISQKEKKSRLFCLILDKKNERN